MRDYISQGHLRRRGRGAARPARGMLGRGLQNGQPQGCARYGPARAAPAAPGSAPALLGLCSAPAASLPSLGSAPPPPGLREAGVGVCARGGGVPAESGAGGSPPVKFPPFFSRSETEPAVGDGSPRSFPARFPTGKPGWWFGIVALLISLLFPTGKPSLGSRMVFPSFFLLFSRREAEMAVWGSSTVDFSSPFPTGNPTVHSVSFFP